MEWILVIILVFAIYNAEKLPQIIEKLKGEVPQHLVEVGKKTSKELKEKAQAASRELKEKAAAATKKNTADDKKEKSEE